MRCDATRCGAVRVLSSFSIVEIAGASADIARCCLRLYYSSRVPPKQSKSCPLQRWQVVILRIVTANHLFRSITPKPPKAYTYIHPHIYTLAPYLYKKYLPTKFLRDTTVNGLKYHHPPDPRTCTRPSSRKDPPQGAVRGGPHALQSTLFGNLPLRGS
jgi:hypothetical protein